MSPVRPTCPGPTAISRKISIIFLQARNSPRARVLSQQPPSPPPLPRQELFRASQVAASRGDIQANFSPSFPSPRSGTEFMSHSSGLSLFPENSTEQRNGAGLPRRPSLKRALLPSSTAAGSRPQKPSSDRRPSLSFLRAGRRAKKEQLAVPSNIYHPIGMEIASLNSLSPV